MAIRVGQFNYNPIKIVGEGSNGTIVFRGSLWLYANKPVAVKRMQKGKQLNELDVQREVELMTRARDHPNILRYIHQENDENFLFIVTELCSGTLQDYFNKKYRGPKLVSDWDILRQITKGLKYLHELEIVHRDVKPTNILIRVNGTKPIMKLADLSVSKVLKTDRKDFSNTNLTNPSGTRGWMAPEVYEFDRFDFSVDIWALGCIFGYTLTKGNKHPFGEDPDQRVISIKGKQEMLLVKADLKNPYSKDDVTIKLIQSMLTVDPSKRPTIKRIKKSAFFLFDLEQTEKLLALCDSLKDSVIDHKIAHFKQLVKDKTVDVNAVTQDGWTPLLYLCRYCEHDSLIDLLYLLMKRACCANVRTKNDGSNPLHLLCQHYNKNNLLYLIQLLIAKGTSANDKTNHGNTPLLLLCENYKNDNLIDIVQLLIENGADAKAKNVEERTPLYLLCLRYESNLLGAVQFLIENGADTNAKSKLRFDEDYTPLHAVCHSNCDNSLDVFKLLTENGADVNAKTKDGITPLHLVICDMCSNGNLIDIVQLLIQKGANINAIVGQNRNKGCTSLHMLFQYNKSDNLVYVARLLMENGADLNAKDDRHNTPLHTLCKFNESDKLFDVAQLLIEKDADLNANNNSRDTPLHTLCEYNKSDNLAGVAGLLIEKGADLNAKNTFRETPLHTLCECNKTDNLLDVARLLIEKGADVNAKKNWGDTPLHILLEHNKSDNLIDVVRLLIEKSADLNAKDNNGKTPLHTLCENSKSDNLLNVAVLLIEKGSDLNANGFRENTPLHTICQYNKSDDLVDIVRLFIEKGADIKAKNTYGVTPLHSLCQNCESDKLTYIVEILVERGADVNAKATYGVDKADVMNQEVLFLCDDRFPRVKGYTPLHVLCHYNKSKNMEDVFRLLIQKGANINEKTEDGLTPTDILRERGIAYEHFISSGSKTPQDKNLKPSK